MTEIIMDIWEANRIIEQLRERNAALENAMQAMSAKCVERQNGRCDALCLGQVLCDCQGLAIYT